MSDIRAFTLDSPIDEVAKSLGLLYEHVPIAKDPMFGWVQIVNDVTILGEELRRNRTSEGATRAAKVLFRLLEFLGYYFYIRKPPEITDFADMVAWELQQPGYGKVGLPDGVSSWILTKYPWACSKCGKRPCHCLVTPWVVEERREKPGPYEALRQDADAAIAKLEQNGVKGLTLSSMLGMFEEIYKNQFYNQEPWKVGMHLSEEIGEATIELSRLELAWRGSHFNVKEALNRVYTYTENKIDREIERMKKAKASAEDIKRRSDSVGNAFQDEKIVFENDGWKAFRSRVSDKFKEETSDVFSWLSAALIKLDPDRVALEKQRSRFLIEDGGVEYLKCPWCGNRHCKDDCLVTHSISSEIIEKITKY